MQNVGAQRNGMIANGMVEWRTLLHHLDCKSGSLCLALIHMHIPNDRGVTIYRFLQKEE